MPPRIRPLLLSCLLLALSGPVGGEGPVQAAPATDTSPAPPRITAAAGKRRPAKARPTARIAAPPPLRFALTRSLSPAFRLPEELAGFPSSAAPALGAEPPARSPAAKSDDSSLGYRYRLNDQTSVNAGVGWVQDLGMENDRLAQRFKTVRRADTPDTSSALNLRLGGSQGPLTLTGGYLQVVDMTMRPNILAALAEESDPAAWNGELAYNTSLHAHDATLALGYQRSLETTSCYLPEERFSTRASLALGEAATLTVEYFHDRGYLSDAVFLDDERHSVITSLDFKL